RLFRSVPAEPSHQFRGKVGGLGGAAPVAKDVQAAAGFNGLSQGVGQFFEVGRAGAQPAHYGLQLVQLACPKRSRRGCCRGLLPGGGSFEPGSGRGMRPRRWRPLPEGAGRFPRGHWRLPPNWRDKLVSSVNSRIRSARSMSTLLTMEITLTPVT